MFIDQVKIFVKAGDGGNGCVSFRREKYVSKGGPNGGDAGKGGDVILEATAQLTTLLDLRYQQQYRVKRAAHGQGSNRHGKDSPDRIIQVPLGTLVREATTQEVLADLTRKGQQVIVAGGGRGGRGNAAFATPTNRTPRKAEEGKPGEECWLLLELKLLAEVGLVGLPNAGKSTLISRISAARPKIANYPFTTLTPHLGTVNLGDGNSFVVADIPGLIEGAHEGKGLGTQFLRHIERTTFLLLLVDVGVSAMQEPVKGLEILRQEVASYSRELSEKAFAIVATKIDSKGNGLDLARLKRFCHRKQYDLLQVSAVTGEGIQELIRYLGKRVSRKGRWARADVS